VLLLTSHEGGKDRIVITTNGKYLVASLLAASFYQGNHDMNHKLWNIGSTERDIEKCTPYAGAAGNAAPHKSKVRNCKIEIVSFVVEFRFKPTLTLNIEV